MREIITQLQPGREGGRQGSRERGREGTGPEAKGVRRDRKGTRRGWGGVGGKQQGMGWKDEGPPLSITRFQEVWETGLWGLGDNWRQLATGQWWESAACNKLLLHSSGL